MFPNISRALGLAGLIALLSAPLALAQGVNGEGREGSITQDDRKFDPRDLSGVWRGTLYAYGKKVPAFTA